MGKVAFTTPGVDRIFLACDTCKRMVPHYRIYGRGVPGRCKCGGNALRPVRLPEWRAAWWVVIVGWLWRRTLRRCEEWDPRMPIRRL